MWRPIKGYEGLYELSHDGRVKRLKGFWCRADRELPLRQSSNGYMRVGLSSRDRRNPRKFLVHRLVFSHFIGPIPDGMTVNHVNGDKTDNRPSNLELATMREQMQHAYATGLQKRAKGEARKNVAKLTEQQVREIRKRYKWRSVTSLMLASEYGVSKACILSVVKRIRWAHVD